MPLIPPPWMQEVVRLTAPKVHAQIQVVLEAYALARDDACPFIEPTLACHDCGTSVQLQESRTRPLRAEWWEIVACNHVKGHRSCSPIYRPHTRVRCDKARVISGRGKLTIYDLLLE